MIEAVKAAAKRHWPLLRLRTILLLAFVVVAALPGLGAVFLRVYENGLVRQTEAELIAQGAALAAVEASRSRQSPAARYAPEPTRIDLSRSAILAERPPPLPFTGSASAGERAMASRLAPVMQGTQRVTLASIILLGRDGRVLVGPRSGTLAHLREVRTALAGRSATVLRRNGDYRPTYAFEWLSRAAALRVHHARPIIVDGRVEGVLLLSRSARTLYRGLYQDRGRIALGIALILLTLIVLAALLSRGIARPIEALRAAAHEVARGQGARIPAAPVTAAAEIQDLYRDFGVMAEAIERRSRYLRDFAHSVSHEFKTPLTAIRGGIELLRDHGEGMTAVERERFLANVERDAERLTRLLSRLLDLARADMAPVREMAVTNLEAPLARAADALRDATFAVELDVAPDLAPVSAPEDLVEAIATALLDNSRQAGAACVSIAARRDGIKVAIILSDDGPGIHEHDRERVFEPFFTGRRDAGGTGLGLAIVRSLLASVNGTIELLPAATGAAFRIQLPSTLT